MKIVGYTFLALFILFPGLQSLAQSQEVKFKRLSGTNGFALGKIVGIARDSHGAMWFADQTNRCVTRFDGNTMTRYYDPKNVNLLGPKNAECLMADSAGFLWIGYNGMGLNRFDPETNTYTHYEHSADDPESLSSNYVSAMLIDRFGNFWVGTTMGLDRLDQKSGKFIRYHHNASDSSSLSDNNVRDLYEDSQGTLWVGTGFTWDRNNHGGLNRFNRQQNNFTRYLHDPANPHTLIDNKVRAIFEDDHGNFWIGTRDNGIHLLDRKSGRIDRIPINTDGTKGLIRPPVTSPFDHITFITQDATGFLWFGTESAGLIRYDPLTQTSLQYGSKSNITSGFTDNSGFCCYTSPDGPMWVGTGEASVFQVELFTNKISEHVVDSLVINDITEETDSILWMGTQNGLLRADLQNGSVQQFKHDPQNPESISDNVVVAVAKDSDGMMWLGTQNGLNMIDPRTHIIKRILHDPNNKESLSNNNIKGFFEDKDHNLWIATYGGGLNRLDKGTEKFFSYVNDPADTNSISENLVAGILQDDDGSLWVRTNTSGLNRLDIATGKFRRYLQGKPGNHFFKDSKGVIWVSTNFGIYCYNKETDKFYQPEDLKAAFKNEVVNIITEDHQQNMWMATSNGIYRLDQKNRGLIRLGLESGIYAQFVHTIKVNQKGHLRLINATGFYVLDPNKIKIAPIVPKIHFTNLIVNGELAKVGQNELLKEPFFNTKEIILSYEQNIFSIGVGAIDYSDVATKTAHYKLEGYDKDWRELTSENQVYYFGVPPGRYRFIATATNRSNGVRVEKSVSIRINPPWWNTIWAYFMYAIVFVAIVYGAHRIQKDRLVKIERAKAQVRELEQAREIEKAYSTLKATQAQLIQSEKMASLGELTAGIAHEIQNPLNFVNNFSDLNKELVAEMEDEIEKGNIEEVKAIAKGIAVNEEKINHHGKRADAIVKGMLQHSRTSSGQKELTDINALSDEYIRLSYHGLRAKDKSFNATMKTDFDENIGSINIVPQEIGRVILNLINNAFYAVSAKASDYAKASSDKSATANGKYEPTVSISTKKTGNKILISVADNGAGIPPKVLDKIFQPFFTTKPTGQGTGLGLSLSYDIIKAHGGELKVNTTEGQGAEFIIELPIKSNT